METRLPLWVLENTARQIDDKRDLAVVSSLSRKHNEATLRYKFQELVFYVNSDTDSKIAGKIFQKYGTKVGPFVRQVTLKSGQSYDVRRARNNFDNVMKLLTGNAPNVRTIVIHGVQRDRLIWGVGQLAHVLPSFAQVTTAQFTECDLPGNVLTDFLLHLPNLRTVSTSATKFRNTVGQPNVAFAPGPVSSLHLDCEVGLTGSATTSLTECILSIDVLSRIQALTLVHGTPGAGRPVGTESVERILKALRPWLRFLYLILKGPFPPFCE